MECVVQTLSISSSEEWFGKSCQDWNSRRLSYLLEIPSQFLTYHLWQLNAQMWDFSSNNMLGIIWLKFSVLVFYFWTSRQQVQFYKLVKSGRMRIETVLRIETVSWEIASQAAFAIQITSNKFILWVLLVFKMIKMSVTSFFFGTFFERLYNTLICRLQNGYNIWEKKSNHYCF